MQLNTKILAAFALSLASTATCAATVETFKITANDGATNDYYGYSVAVDGTTAIVGAYGDDNYSGSAYLFDTTTGEQITKLTLDDSNARDYFGYSVAISGSTAIVGVYGDDTNGTSSGAAYLFDTTTGEQIAKLTADDAASLDYFGRTVATSGTTAIVGAIFEDENGTNSGAAYLFDTTTGEQIAKLTADDGQVQDRFGNAVAIYESTAIVGASRDDDNGSNSGSAYLFDTETGEQIAKLTADDAESGDYFGGSVAISGSIAVVGAHSAANDDGAVYVFDITTGQQIAKFTANNSSEHIGHFGSSVDLYGNIAIIGAEDSSKGTGTTYIFDVTSGEQLAKITASDGDTLDYFGNSVSLSGTTAIIGAYGDDDNGDISGSAYLYDISNLTTVAPVPLPAGIWLLGSALGLGALARRRRG